MCTPAVRHDVYLIPNQFITIALILPTSLVRDYIFWVLERMAVVKIKPSIKYSVLKFFIGLA